MRINYRASGQEKGERVKKEMEGNELLSLLLDGDLNGLNSYADEHFKNVANIRSALKDILGVLSYLVNKQQ